MKQNKHECSEQHFSQQPRNRNNPNISSTDEWVNRLRWIHSLEYYLAIKMDTQGFPGGSVAQNPPANVGDLGLIPDPGRSHMLRIN